MKLLLINVILVGLTTSTIQADDWPWWRGPERNGIASADQTPPLEWSESEHVRWKTKIPGRGHGSPSIVGNRIFLATAQPKQETRSVICLDRETGQQLWKRIVHRGHVTPHRNKRGTEASSTPACDGERVYINFLHQDQMVTTALDMEGQILWQRPICDYKVHQGFGSSPLIYKNFVIVIADNKLGGAVAGLNRKNGEIIWINKRPETPNYPSPILLQADDQTQLILTGCDLVTSLNPSTGETHWETSGATTECVTSTVTDGTHVYSSGGYPKNHVAAVKADGSGELVWENNTRVYVPSMFIKDGYLYGVADAGIAHCWNAATGKVMWKGRLEGTFSSSPVLVGSLVFVTNESGLTFIYKADSKEFQLVGTNQLEEECFATPVFLNNNIFTRVADHQNDSRQEYLYCIAGD